MQAHDEGKSDLEQIAQLLNSTKPENITVSAGQAVVTVSPKLELLSVILTGPALAEHREGLQRDIVEAVNKAMREVVLASARALEGLQESPEMQSARELLQKEIDRRHTDGGTPSRGAES
jgi:DNA-binding protein YbaB